MLIAGAGPAGSATGLLLARQGLSVGLCNPLRKNDICIGETLPPHASTVLRRLGLWENFKSQDHTPSPGTICAWGQVEPVTREFVFSAYGNGWHLDRARFNSWLIEEAERAGVSIARAVALPPEGAGNGVWRVTLKDATHTRTVVTRFFIDATGRVAGRNSTQSNCVRTDSLIAITGRSPAKSSDAESAYTLVEAVDEGWFYTAMLPSREYIVAYMTDSDLYAASRARNVDFLSAQLEKARLTHARLDGAPAALKIFPAFSSVRCVASGPAWLAVGDAARSLDPLSGLGISSALEMACDAAETLAQLLHGNRSATERYDLRNRENFAVSERTRRAYYGVERRWPSSLFWQRRWPSGE